MKTIWIAIGPVVAIVVALAVRSAGAADSAALTAGITALCAVWWVTEAIPIPATSLLPMALLPLMGVATSQDVAQAYGHPLILLLMAGFMLSTAMEKSGAHRRLALLMVRLCAGGTKQATQGEVTGRRLVLGFMLATTVLSMWVSNAATTLMLLPIALATLERSGDSRLRTALLLGIAYSASIAGVGTPVGTPPNLICLQQYADLTGAEPTFTSWMSWALPIVVLMIPCSAIWLTRGLGRAADIDLPEVGAWRAQEVRTLAVFGATALLWVTCKEPFGGWSEWTGLSGANDATVALLAVVVMFLIPSGERNEQGEADRLLDWETAKRIPWGMLLLFSGGMVLASGFRASGLSDLLGGALIGLADAPTPLLLAGICLSVTFLTEVTSNTATTALLMPLLASMSEATGLDPRLLMVPAAISASFAFMLPVATVPNAVVYGAGVSTRKMAAEGFALNLIGAAIISLVCYWQFG